MDGVKRGVVVLCQHTEQNANTGSFVFSQRVSVYPVGLGGEGGAVVA